MLNFCSKDNFASDIEVTPIHKVNEAYERVVKSDVRYRFVIDMKSLLLCSQEYKNSQIWVRKIRISPHLLLQNLVWHLGQFFELFHNQT
jgi:hypothetical protein